MPHTLELSQHQTGKLGQRQHGQHLQKPGCEIGNIMHMHNCSRLRKMRQPTMG